jgi:hypothetical protein
LLLLFRGWTAIINDDLISKALSCGVVALSVITMICGVLLSLLFDLYAFSSVTSDNASAAATSWAKLALLGGVIGLLVGIFVGIVLVNALDSAVAMVFVCFAEDPLALQVSEYLVFDCNFLF